METMKIEALCIAFGEKQVLKDFSVQLPLGQTTVLMGTSGCGKTTLLRILAGLEQPDSGRLSGVPVRKSMIFQENRLCENATAWANLHLCAPKLTKEQAQEALLALGLPDWNTQPVREFSGGMKRRVAILRALCADYDLLLADEPFQGLDEETKLRTMEYFRAHTAGKTVVLVTHEEDEAEFLGNLIKL